MLPTVDELLDGAVEFAVPLRTRFRRTTVRHGVLLPGPAGWGEFAPFPEYGSRESARWLAAAVESAWLGWPEPRRGDVEVNAIVPAVPPDEAARLVGESGCRTAKVKVAEPGQSLVDDVARVAAVRAALGPHGRIRVDTNGAWSLAEATVAAGELGGYGLEYLEQPCATVAECAQLRARCDVPIAVDEGLRRSADPARVVGVRDAADVLVLKVPPLGGVRAAVRLADRYALPCVVSSALDTSVGLAAGAALAGALPTLDHACGLGSGLLLAADVSDDRLLPRGGRIAVPRRAPEVRADAVRPVSAGWRQRVSDAYQVLSATPDPFEEAEHQ